MKRLTGLVLLGLAITAGIVVAQQNKQGELELQAAIRTETVNGDLKGAIQQYEKILAKYGSDRTVTGSALVHMAMCYEKLGDNESKKIYARIVRDYPDQKDAITVATAHLGGSTPHMGLVSRQIWTTTKGDINPSVSPDGSYSSYVDWSTGALVLHELRNSTERTLASDGLGQSYKEYAEDSAISRDGKLVAYSWRDKDRNYGLRLVNLEGEPKPRRLYDNSDIEWIAPYDWTPDGKSVVVELTRKDRIAQIGFISIPDGSLHVLKSVDWRGTGRIFLSPDGKYLAYGLSGRDSTRERDIFILAADGTREFSAITDPSFSSVMGWSPDGKRLLFASDRTGGMALWSIPIVDGKTQGIPELLRSDVGWPFPMGVTRSGAFYYWIDRMPANSNIQVASFDAETGRISSARNVGQEQPESNSLPNWSPDSRYLAYLSRRPSNSGRNFSLVIRSMDTDQTLRDLPLKLDEGAGVVKLLRWSPDGRSLQITGTDSKGRWGLHQVDAQTGDTSAISVELPRESAWDPAVSPDGQTFYIRRRVSNPDGFAFIQRDLASGKEKELIRKTETERHGSASPVLAYVNLSPDGRYIATRSFSGNSMTVLLIPTSGGEPRDVLKVQNESGVGCPGLPLVWERDSRTLLVQTCSDGQHPALWRALVNGGEPHQIGAVTLQRVPAVAPDGRHIAFVVTAQATAAPHTEVWVLENFLPAHRKDD